MFSIGVILAEVAMGERLFTDYEYPERDYMIEVSQRLENCDLFADPHFAPLYDLILGWRKSRRTTFWVHSVRWDKTVKIASNFIIFMNIFIKIQSFFTRNVLKNVKFRYSSSQRQRAPNARRSDS